MGSVRLPTREWPGARAHLLGRLIHRPDCSGPELAHTLLVQPQLGQMQRLRGARSLERGLCNRRGACATRTDSARCCFSLRLKSTSSAARAAASCASCSRNCRCSSCALRANTFAPPSRARRPGGRAHLLPLPGKPCIALVHRLVQREVVSTGPRLLPSAIGIGLAFRATLRGQTQMGWSAWVAAGGAWHGSRSGAISPWACLQGTRRSASPLPRFFYEAYRAACSTRSEALSSPMSKPATGRKRTVRCSCFSMTNALSSKLPWASVVSVT